MKENINYKILYRILRQYSYNRNMEAMNILYKELVLEGVIPEFKFNMEVWKNDKSGKNVWKWYQEGILDIEWEEPMLIILLINKMINMTDEQVVEKLIGILQPIYQEGRLTEDEVNEIFYYATIGNSMVEHGDELLKEPIDANNY